MKQSLALTLVCSFLALAGCQKKAAEVAPAATQEPVQTTAAQPAELTDAEKEKAEKLSKMEYAVMEDSYINDPKAQWASTAKVSSTYGEAAGRPAEDAFIPGNATGKVDGTTWVNNSEDIGFDWIELSYEKPVFATEVRLVTDDDNTTEAIAKIELQDIDGKWNTIWSGISEQKRDERGERTWFVKKFDKTSYQVKAVKYTLANNISPGYKHLDASQLVGE